MNDEEKCIQYSTIYIFKWGGWDYMYLLVYIHIHIYKYIYIFVGAIKGTDVGVRNA